MKLFRVLAIAKKELIQIRRDPLSLAMAFLMPAMLLFLFGYAITLDVDRITTVVCDNDRSSLSRELIAGFRESGYFLIVRTVEREPDPAALLDDGRAKVALSIPVGFSRDIRSGRKASYQALVDGSDSNTATIASGYIEAITARYGQKISGFRPAAGIDPRIRVWYNPELKSRNFIFPGLIAVIMAVIAALLTSLTIAREWERGTMEQLLSTPVRTPELIAGKLIPYFLIGFLDLLLAVFMAIFVFNVPLKGSIILLMALSGLFLFGGLSVGMLISTVARAQLVASQISMIVTFMPAFLLSGFMFAIANMPGPLQMVTSIVPARYFVAILKGVFLKGNTIGFLVFETFFLAVFGILVFLLAVRKFRRRVA